jgi:Flp pilus assembly protein TadB
MTCARCQAEVGDDRRWCATCELDYDAWSRRYATDIVYSALGGMVVVIIVPLLGVPWVWATTAILGGSATILGSYRWNRQRRRRQFLAGAAVPRAYLKA